MACVHAAPPGGAGRRRSPLLGDELASSALAVVFVVVGLGFGAVAAPTFSSVYRTVPPEAVAQATTTMFIAVQLSASLGVTILGLVLSDPATTVVGGPFAVLALVAAAIALLAARLPGPAVPAASEA